MAARPAHLVRLQALQDKGWLLLAGPFPAVGAADPAAAGFTGSLIVAEFASLQAAQEWAEARPVPTRMLPPADSGKLPYSHSGMVLPA